MHIEVDENQSEKSLAIGAQVGKSAATIMAALLLEGGVDFLTPAVAKRCREAALIAHGVEDDAPGAE